MSHPQSYEILLVPEFNKSGRGAPAPGTAIRSGVVAATGDTGSSGYPRYAGDGIEADIDPATRTVEALLVDGAELDYSLSVRIAERVGGTTVDEADEGFVEEPAELAEEPPEPPEPTERTEEREQEQAERPEQVELADGQPEGAEAAVRAESAERPGVAERPEPTGANEPDAETSGNPADRPGERT